MSNCPFLSYVGIQKITKPTYNIDIITSTDYYIVPAVESTITYNTEITKIACMTTDCKLWDTTYNRCSLNIEYFHNIFGLENERDDGNSLISYFQDILGKHSEKTKNYSLVKQAQNGASGGPYAATLVNEFMCSQDLDGNDKIYGYDFGIIDSYDKPYILSAVQNNESWGDPTLLVNWNELLTWFNNKYDPDQYNPLA
jgi:hypothetical protein